MTGENKYFVVDLTKLLLAIIVLCSHVQLFAEYPSVNEYFAKYLMAFSLPLFFLFSGYFFAVKVKEKSVSCAYLKTRIKRVFLLYVIWLIPNFLTVYLRFNGASIQYIISSILFSGVYMASWYLNAIIWCMFLVTAISKLLPQVYIYFTIVLGGVLYLIWAGVISDYFNILQIVPKHSFLYGMIFFSLGVFLSKVRIPLFVNIPILFCSYILYILDIGVAFSLIFVVFSVASLFIQYTPNGSKDLGRKFRASSTIIYLGHPALIIVLKHLVSPDPLIVLIITLTLLFTLSFFVQRYEKRYPLLSYLH